MSISENENGYNDAEIFVPFSDDNIDIIGGD